MSRVEQPSDGDNPDEFAIPTRAQWMRQLAESDLPTEARAVALFVFADAVTNEPGGSQHQTDADTIAAGLDMPMAVVLFHFGQLNRDPSRLLFCSDPVTVSAYVS